MTVVFVGLGSNLDSPRQQVASAMAELDAIEKTRVSVRSSFYQSKPVGPQDQDDFINAVVKLETSLPAEILLNALQDLENHHGRRRLRHWGPRTLDLDILSYGDNIINTERLKVPHPEIPNRTFVLLPWSEIAPEWDIPGFGKVAELLAGCVEALPEKVN